MSPRSRNSNFSLKLSKTVLSFNDSVKRFSLSSLHISETNGDEDKENVPPPDSSASGYIQGNGNLLRGRSVVTTPARAPLAAAGPSPPSVLKKAMRSVSKSALERAYAAIHGDPTGKGKKEKDKGKEAGVLVPVPAEPPKIEVFGTEDENGGLKIPATLPPRINTPPAVSPLVLPDEREVDLNLPPTPTPLPKQYTTLMRSSTISFHVPPPIPPRTNNSTVPPAPAALRAALGAVSDSSVRSAYAAFRRGQSLDDSCLPTRSNTVSKNSNGKSKNNNSNKKHHGGLNHVATIAARRAFNKRPALVRHRSSNPGAFSTSMKHHTTAATTKNENPFVGDKRYSYGNSRNNSAVWWSQVHSHPSSFASTPAHSILDFSPDRSGMGRRKKIRRFFRKVVEKFRRHKVERRKLEKKTMRGSIVSVGEEKGFIGERGRRATMRDF